MRLVAPVPLWFGWLLTAAHGSHLRHRRLADPQWQVGSTVALQGLVHSAELNGQEAVVEGFDSSEDRYVVRMTESNIYKKVKPEHLQMPSESQEPHQGEPDSPACGAEAGPKGFSQGAEVVVHGLTSASAASLNGQLVLVRCFNMESGRYVVQGPGGTYWAVKAEHLSVQGTERDGFASDQSFQNSGAEVKSEVEDVIQEIPDTTHRVLHPGSHAKLVGLQNTAMNGKVVQIAGFDSGRYTVKLPDGAVRKVEAAKLEETDQAPPPRISVCNVFGRHKKLKVVVQSEDASHSKAIGTLDFQACEDLKELAFEKGNVLFMMGSKEVARAAFDLPALGKGRGAELTVAPFPDDHHKARVHKNVVELDDGQAYYLHLVDAHAGPRRAKLSVQRGLTAKVLPLDKSYRLERVEDMALTLTDGAKRVKLAFKPQKARTYCAIVTGSETSDNAGLVLHKLGEWTSAGQLSDEV